MPSDRPLLGAPDELSELARHRCAHEPFVSGLDPTRPIAIPQRTIRQPKRRSGEPTPPLIRMVRAGQRGADTRVQIYLWLWAVASSRGFAELSVRRTTGEWAELLNLIPDAWGSNQPKRSTAARRVARALDYLQGEGLISRSGPNVVRLLEPDGSGRDYRPWSQAELQHRQRERDSYRDFFKDRTDLRRTRVWEDPPLQLPPVLWSSGTISVLSGSELVVLLVLWDYETTPGETIRVPKSRPFEYPITSSTWRRGLAQLEARGAIRRIRGPLVFAGSNANPLVTDDRFLSWWQLDRVALGIVSPLG